MRNVGGAANVRLAGKATYGLGYDAWITGEGTTTVDNLLLELLSVLALAEVVAVGTEVVTDIALARLTLAVCKAGDMAG